MNLLDVFRQKPQPMGLVEKRGIEERFWAQWGSLFGGPSMSSGLTVTEAQAFRLAPVSQAVQLISEEIATLPLEVWRTDDQTPSREKALRHPAYRLLRWEASDLYTAAQWRRISMIHTLLYGNGISEIIRDASSRPVAIWPIEPWRIQMFWWEATGSERRVFYRYTPVSGGQRDIQPEDVIHIRAMDSMAGLWGDSPVLRCAGAIGLTQAAQDFASSFFSNGANLSGVLEHPGSLGEEAYKSLKQSWAETHTGGPNKSYKPSILEEGMTWKPISTPPEEGQMIETRDQQVKEIARVFNLPPHRLGASTDSFTYSNEVQERQAFYTSSIRPWAVQIEQEINAKVLGRGFRADFDFTEALRADMKTRYDSHSIAIAAGWLLRNEVRISEGLNEIPGLDDEPEEGEEGSEGAEEGETDTEGRVAIREVLGAAVARLIGKQVRDLDALHSDKREDYFNRHLDDWAFALGPVARAARALNLAFPDPDRVGERFCTLHSRELDEGLDDLAAAWSAEDITEEIMNGTHH